MSRKRKEYELRDASIASRGVCEWLLAFGGMNSWVFCGFGFCLSSAFRDCSVFAVESSVASSSLGEGVVWVCSSLVVMDEAGTSMSFSSPVGQRTQQTTTEMIDSDSDKDAVQAKGTVLKDGPESRGPLRRFLRSSRGGDKCSVGKGEILAALLGGEN